MHDNAPNGQAENEKNALERLVFVHVVEIEDGVFRGAALVTDDMGRPLEFRCTTPIKPTNLHKILYGDTLFSHIAVELVGRPILKSLKEKYDVVLAKLESFVELRKNVDCPILLIRRQGTILKEERSTNQPRQSELLKHATGRFDPIIVTAHWNYDSDITNFSRGLNDIFSHLDLVEPFDRIDTAVKLVHKNESSSRS